MLPPHTFAASIVPSAEEAIACHCFVAPVEVTSVQTSPAGAADPWSALSSKIKQMDKEGGKRLDKDEDIEEETIDDTSAQEDEAPDQKEDDSAKIKADNALAAIEIELERAEEALAVYEKEFKTAEAKATAAKVLAKKAHKARDKASKVLDSYKNSYDVAKKNLDELSKAEKG